MTTITAPAPQAHTVSGNGEKPINLFQLGCLFVIRASYWSCRIGNEPQDFNLSGAEIESKAIASFGSKELIDPEKGRRVFQQIEKKARHQLGRYSRPFPAANAHFVPWGHVLELIDQLQALQAEFAQAAEDFLVQYPQLRAGWQAAHPEVPDAAYPAAWELRNKFGFGWHTFKVTGAASAMAIDDIEAELAGQQVRAEQLAQMKQNLRAECQQFVEQYVLGFRREVAEFCDQVVKQKGQVHGKTLQAIRRKIETFHKHERVRRRRGRAQAAAAQGRNHRADRPEPRPAARRGRQAGRGLPGAAEPDARSGQRQPAHRQAEEKGRA
jgi:hypothetical protein